MIQRTIDIKAAAMAAFEKESKRLLICLEEDNLLVALADKLTSEWNALENFSLSADDWQHMPETLQQVKQQSSLLNLKVPDTQLYFRTAEAMPIPAGLRADNKLFIQTAFGLQSPDEMLTDEVSLAMNVCIVVPAELISAFRHILPRATWNSTLALLIKQAQQLPGKTMLPQLFLTLSHSLAEMVFIKNDQLIIARCFSFVTPENLLYHLLNTCHQLGISPAELFIKAQGHLDENSEIYSLLHQYFTHIEIITANTRHWDKAFDDLPFHNYTHLIGS